MRLRKKIVKSAGNFHHLYFTVEEGLALCPQKNKRVIISIHDSLFVHRKLMPIKAGGFYVMLGKAVLKKAKLSAGQEIEIEVELDTSEHQFEMPEALIEVFALDAEAQQQFNTLTPGRRRSLMHMVASVKSVDKQIERALKIADSMKMGISDPRQVLK